MKTNEQTREQLLNTIDALRCQIDIYRRMIIETKEKVDSLAKFVEDLIDED